MQRTLRTAQAVADVVVREHHDSQRADAASTLNIVKVDELREKHMGALEGSKWGVKPPGDKAESFSDDMETREHMSARAVKFIDEHLVPALEPHFACDRSSNRATARGSILVVSHGIFLNIFLRSLLERFAPAELQRLSNSEAPQPKGLVSFSNTGFVEVVVSARDASATDETDPVRLPGRVLALHLQVVAINSVGHLQGLKKTRGGIGSAAFDSKQRTMDAFFGPAMKKPRRQ